MTTSFDPAIRALAEMVVECIADEILNEQTGRDKQEQCDNASWACRPTSSQVLKAQGLAHGD